MFNTNKCNWYLHGSHQIKNARFILNNKTLKKTDSLIHLGLPIGSQKHVEEFFSEKFRKVERILFAPFTWL